MRAGRLRHFVTIEHLVAGSPDQLPTGELDRSWATFAQVWASIEPLKGRELFAAQSVHSEVTALVVMRYLADVDATMRVNHGGTYYMIEARIDPEQRHRELQLWCSEGSQQT